MKKRDYKYYQDLLLEVIVSVEAIEEWMDKPNPEFEGRCPRNVIYEGDGWLIEQIYWRLVGGVLD